LWRQAASRSADADGGRGLRFPRFLRFARAIQGLRPSGQQSSNTVILSAARDLMAVVGGDSIALRIIEMPIMPILCSRVSADIRHNIAPERQADSTQKASGGLIALRWKVSTVGSAPRNGRD
jgi:hypothetical protein